jgi:hypothetical protein
MKKSIELKVQYSEKSASWVVISFLYLWGFSQLRRL